MERRIVGFVQDDTGDWVAQLDCFHAQHVRHNPPFRSAPWVLDDASRAARVGTVLDCPLCDRAELPDGLTLHRVTPTWDEHTLPPGLRRGHRVAAGTWGRIRVVDGALRFVTDSRTPIDVVISAGAAQAIPPDVVHEVEPQGSVRFFVEFLGKPSV
jgi:tellurite methyltransferase